MKCSLDVHGIVGKEVGSITSGEQFPMYKWDGIEIFFLPTPLLSMDGERQKKGFFDVPTKRLEIWFPNAALVKTLGDKPHSPCPLCVVRYFVYFFQLLYRFFFNHAILFSIWIQFK